LIRFIKNMLHCPTRRTSRLPRPILWSVLVALTVLTGCSTSQIDAIPHAVGGLPEGAPARPAAAPAFPNVHEMPPDRAALLDAEQQKRLHDDLIATRNRQPNQEKNIAADKKRAAEQARKLEEERNRPADSKKGRRRANKPPSQSGGLFNRGNLPIMPDNTGARQNP